MPRQRRGAAPARSAPSRPTVTSSRPAGSQLTSNRNASTSAHPPAVPQANGPPARAGQGPGLFGQMASTAAYGNNSPKLFRPTPPRSSFHIRANTLRLLAASP